MITDHKHLHLEKNWFTAIFSAMSAELKDPQSNQPTLFFKMTFKSQLQIYPDKNKTQLLLESRFKREHGKLWNWDIFDMERGGEQIGNMSLNILKSTLKFGSQDWKICGPDGMSEIMKMSAPDDSAAKRILDNMSGLYNPAHHYVLTNPSGQTVADITSKHGLMKGTYDLMLQGGTEKEQKIAIALFSALVLMLRK